MLSSSHWSHISGRPNQNPVNITPLPMRATYPAQLILLDLITQIILCEEYWLWSSLLCNFIHDPSSSPSGPTILLNILFSETPNLWSSIKLMDQISHPYGTSDKITF